MTKPHPGSPYFVDLAERLGRSYLRYSFTKGSDQEVGFLVELLRLPLGARLLDVGCGPGRHAVRLAQAGLAVTGVDVSRRFLELAAEDARAAGVRASFFEVDARRMPFEDEFDAVISLCQGGFGLMGGDDSVVLKRMMEALKPGGRLVMTAFSALFEARHPRPEADFDADAGIVHEVSQIKNDAGAEEAMDLWTSVYTPRELRLLAIGVGLIPEEVWSVAPGEYARRKPDLEHPELMLVARKPAA
ncbi:MAG: methyltransferase domain-containing protein [Actinomycetota bacterium]|nr:methyltransferase domain-containing protein [Actinomycetota bacterium]